MSVGPPVNLPRVTLGPVSSPTAVTVGVPAVGVPTVTIVEGDMYYEQDFTVPASTWTITHNFGKSPNVRIIDAQGNTAYPGTADSEDCNTVYVNWPAPMTGKAICS